MIVSAPDDGLRSELVHHEGSLLGVEVVAGNGGEGEVLGGEVFLHLLPALLLLPLSLGALRLCVQERLLLLHLDELAH